MLKIGKVRKSSLIVFYPIEWKLLDAIPEKLKVISTLAIRPCLICSCF